MKQVAILGMGMGPATLTAQGLEALEQAEVLLGAPRMLAALSAYGPKSAYPAYEPGKVKEIIRESGHARFAVLVSGDTGFFSAAQGLLAALDQEEVTVLPGVSCVSYFFAKLRLPWQEAALVSCHARRENLADTVRRHPLTFALTGGNVNALAGELVEAGFGGLTAILGENLGAQGERIRSLSVAELADAPVEPLAVLLVENPQADARVLSGIPDAAFIRGDVPMTKAEVRAVVLSRLALSPAAVCCDIGAGTGSVTVEMALAAYRGRVYAVDHKEEALSLVRENCRRFHLGNVTPVLGKAPQALEPLPPLDAAFIGGSGGAMREIFQAVLCKNPSARLAVTAIALETLGEALQAFREHGISPQITQLSVAQAKPLAELSMMMAQNPVFILSGGGPHA